MLSVRAVAANGLAEEVEGLVDVVLGKAVGFEELQVLCVWARRALQGEYQLRRTDD